MYSFTEAILIEAIFMEAILFLHALEGNGFHHEGGPTKHCLLAFCNTAPTECDLFIGPKQNQT